MSLENPPSILVIQPPKGHLKRIQFLAKALAYGAISDQWSPTISVSPAFENGPSDGSGGTSWRKLIGEEWVSKGHPNYDLRLKEYLSNLWYNQQPQASFLEALGFLSKSGEPYRTTPQGVIPIDAIDYLLTPKAFALLEEPETPPNIFVSYKRDPSAPFALLIVSRLQAKDIKNVYIDMNMAYGVDWKNTLQEKVKQCRYFICLLAPQTAQSENVRDEVLWAREANTEIIPILHNAFLPDDTGHPEWIRFLLTKNGISVPTHHPLDYIKAIDQLLNHLGYAPF